MPLKRNLLPVLGLLLALASVVGYFGWVVPTLSPRLPWLREVPLLNAALLLLALALCAFGIRRTRGRPRIYRGRVVAPLCGAITLALGAFFAWYTLDFSSQLPAAAGAPAVGAAAPDFTLDDQSGQPVQLAALRGRNVVLVFYRGHW